MRYLDDCALDELKNQKEMLVECSDKDWKKTEFYKNEIKELERRINRIENETHTN
jgi:hypothetical protein